MNVQANKKIDIMESKIDTVESSLDKKLDGFQSEIDQKFENLQYSISRLINQQNDHQEEENPEEECLIDTKVEEHCKQQLQEKLIENFAEYSEGLSESSYIGTVVCPWEKEEKSFPC